MYKYLNESVNEEEGATEADQTISNARDHDILLGEGDSRIWVFGNTETLRHKVSYSWEAEHEHGVDEDE